MNKTVRDSVISAFVLIDESRGAKPGQELKYTRREVDAALEAVATLARIGAELSRMAVRSCSEPMSEAQKADAARREERLAKRAAQAVALFRVRLRVGGDDDRGAQLFLTTPKTGKYNTLGGRECGWAF
jgi:hypothetical protein